MANSPPVTPDGRYLVVRGRLWRRSDPAIPEERRQQLVDELMDARRSVGVAKRRGDKLGERNARMRVDHAKRDLGERGPVWWTDGDADYNRHKAANTPYADWYAGLTASCSG